MAKQFGIRSGTARDARDAPAKGVERAPSYPAEPLESRGTGVERSFGRRHSRRVRHPV
jgi:hypothetical protein